MPDSERATNERPALSLVQPPQEGEIEEQQEQPATEPVRRKPGRPAGSKDKKKRVAKKAGKKVPAAGTRAARAPSARGAGKAEAAPKTQERKGRLVAVRSKELAERAERGDVGADKLLKAIQRKHQQWTKALADKANTSQECGQRLKSAEAAFLNAIEAPLEVGKVELAAVRGKLEAVEVRWQDLSEAKAQNIEERKAARDAVKGALEALNEAIEDSRQQRLPGVA